MDSQAPRARRIVNRVADRRIGFRGHRSDRVQTSAADTRLDRKTDRMADHKAADTRSNRRLVRRIRRSRRDPKPRPSKDSSRIRNQSPSQTGQTQTAGIQDPDQSRIPDAGRSRIQSPDAQTEDQQDAIQKCQIFHPERRRPRIRRVRMCARRTICYSPAGCAKQKRWTLPAKNFLNCWKLSGWRCP